MKKIIKHGYMHYMEATCPSCGCIFSYEWEDLIRKYIYNYNCTNNCYTYPEEYVIICPECEKEFSVLRWHFNWSSEPTKITCSYTKEGWKRKDEED